MLLLSSDFVNGDTSFVRNINPSLVVKCIISYAPPCDSHSLHPQARLRNPPRALPLPPTPPHRHRPSQGSSSWNHRRCLPGRLLPRQVLNRRRRRLGPSAPARPAGPAGRDPPSRADRPAGRGGGRGGPWARARGGWRCTRRFWSSSARCCRRVPRRRLARRRRRAGLGGRPRQEGSQTRRRAVPRRLGSIPQPAEPWDTVTCTESRQGGSANGRQSVRGSGCCQPE